MTRPARIYDALSVEYRYPGDGFQLSVSVLGGERLAMSTGLILGEHTLGQGRLGPIPTGARWESLMREASAIEMRRGGTGGLKGLGIEAGSLTVTLAYGKGQTPREDLYPGLEIRARTIVSGRVLGTFRLDGIKTDERKDGTSFMYLTAYDAVAPVAATMRYGAANPGREWETWPERYARLLASSPVPWQLPADAAGWPSPFLCASVVYESSLASHLDLVAATTRTAWYADTAGILRVLPPGSSPDPCAYFSDSVPSALHYTELGMVHDTTEIINELELQNHARAKDDDGQWAADDHSSTHRALTSLATYGTRAESVDTCLYSFDEEGEAEALAQAIMRGRSRPVRTIASVTLQVPPADPEPATTPDLGDTVMVGRRGQIWTRRVAGITHTLEPGGGHTPDRWEVTYTLTEPT